MLNLNFLLSYLKYYSLFILFLAQSKVNFNYLKSVNFEILINYFFLILEPIILKYLNDFMQT